MFGHHHRYGRHHRHAKWEAFAPWLKEFGMNMGERGYGSGRGRGRGRGSGGRMLKQGELPLLLLTLIENEALHGYALIEAIEARTGGSYAPSPGIVYPSLTLLADMGLAEEQADGSRKLYAITDKGRMHLEERRGEADDILARLDAAKDGGAGWATDNAPIGRAMMNLGAALKLRMWEQKADRNEARRIADILDKAARDIEAG
ncbi:helix-turn-helix transcriptional regulator [Pacificimonas sp. WHA3]|uniref:Helix-turn-helix transcriptional regulator n=1 Tax=Pacificimonas pallii TaxID=2827236 RepID=A0ABS6SFJ9_9SPHN|nr:PadR family transcriptional regulator [Pacificimonas pallii]MBV7257184.1 helix-turn-helix transcriptional regulator [Pacificimonas pallii]